MGIKRKGLVEEPLDRLQPAVPRRHLAAGAVPAQRLGADAARPARSRPRSGPKVFWRGYDVYDPVNVGFVTQGAEAAARRHAVRHQRARGRQQGHVFGTTLPPGEKEALIEYLKTR